MTSKQQNLYVQPATNDKKVKEMESNMVDIHKMSHYTTDSGMAVSNVDNWLKVGSEDHIGANLLEDQIAREKVHRFDHERIPERVVHARGTAAFGKFTLFESLEEFTSAGVLTDTTRETPIFLRFSTVQGSRGSADTVRDVRGFAIKFYTEEGNWDIVGNNIPIFFIQESMKFPDLEPHNEVPQGQSAHNNFWDFMYLHSESTHMFMWHMSDRTIPRSLRMMQGFGVNTYSLVNANGQRVFVKFHFTPHLGVHSLVWDEALKINGQDPDFHRKDLWEAIENGLFPKWKFGVQIIKEEDEHAFEFDILDATKVWPEDLIPVRYVLGLFVNSRVGQKETLYLRRDYHSFLKKTGELELNRNPDNYFAQTEQAAFCTSHIVPGIDFTDDPLLQGRNFSYFDTQISRLGINWEDLPVNRPVCPVMNFNRDGQSQHRITRGQVNYWPNRFDSIPPSKGGHNTKDGFVSYPKKESGIKARMMSKKFKDHITQAQMFWNSLSPIEKQHATNALCFELDHCDEPIVYQRVVERLTEIDLSLAQAVAEKVGVDPPSEQTRVNTGRKAKSLSQFDFPAIQPTIETRKIAILISDGYDSVSYEAVKAAITKAHAIPVTLADKKQPVKAQQAGKSTQPDHHFNGFRSTLFDATVVPDGQHVEALRKNANVRFWIRETFGHNKAIGSIGKANALISDTIKEASSVDVAGPTDTNVTESYGVVTLGKTDAKSLDKFIEEFIGQVSQHRCWQRELDGLSYMVAA